VAVPPADLFVAGQAALDAADWARAKAIFEESLAMREEPEALDGLGQALWWLRDLEGCLRQRERAYLLFREAGNYRRAAFIAAWVAREHVSLYGNMAACQGWLARAAGLLEHEDANCAERGWLEKARATYAGNPVDQERHLRQALAISRRCGDVDLEALALSFLGVVLVQESQIAEGMRCLDEAMAAVTAGEVHGLWTIGEAYCHMVDACLRVGDLRRAEDWTHIVDSFSTRTTNQVTFGLCRIFQGILLTWSGRWDQAERVLAEGLGTFRAGYRALSLIPAWALADLRLRQGRVEEAATLAIGMENIPRYWSVLVSLHLLRGEADAAAALAERYVREFPTTSLDAARFLPLLVAAHIARQDLEAAQAAVQQLQREAESTGLLNVMASAELAAGRLALARHEERAQAHLERAASLFQELGMPLENAHARMELARLHEEDLSAMAIEDGRSALATFEALGARVDADAAAQLLRRLGVKTRTGPKGKAALTQRESEVLKLVESGLSNPEIAARLFVSRRTVEHHVSTILGKLQVRNRAEAVALKNR
jgi:DNA-binding CsgD family transcriptional regulator